MRRYYDVACHVGRYLFQLIVLWKADSSCLRSFMFSWVDKVTTGA